MFVDPIVLLRFLIVLKIISKKHCDLKFFGFEKYFGIATYRLPYVVDVVVVGCFKLTPFVRLLKTQNFAEYVCLSHPEFLPGLKANFYVEYYSLGAQNFTRY